MLNNKQFFSTLTVELLTRVRYEISINIFYCSRADRRRAFLAEAGTIFPMLHSVSPTHALDAK